MCCSILENLGDLKMAYQMKVSVEVTKDDQPFNSNVAVYSNLDFSNLVMLESVLLKAQNTLLEFSAEQVKKGKK